MVRRLVRPRTVRGPAGLLVTVALALGAWAPRADAQSLAEAARQAQEQSRANAGKSVTITMSPRSAPEGRPPLLTEDLLVSYGDARIALAALRRNAKDIQKRLLEGTRHLQHFEDFEGVLAAEPEVVTLLSRHALTPQRYVDVEMILRRVYLMAQFRDLRPERVTARERDNLAFVSTHAGLVSWVWQRCADNEKGLQTWFGAIPSVQ